LAVRAQQPVGHSALAIAPLLWAKAAWSTHIETAGLPSICFRAVSKFYQMAVYGPAAFWSVTAAFDAGRKNERPAAN